MIYRFLRALLPTKESVVFTTSLTEISSLSPPSFAVIFSVLARGLPKFLVSGKDGSVSISQHLDSFVIITNFLLFGVS